jgi:hypothetical protein
MRSQQLPTQPGGNKIRHTPTPLPHHAAACNLATFTLVDCVQSLLGETLEVIPPAHLARLSGLVPTTSSSGSSSAAAGGDGCEMRVARYAVRRVGVVGALLRRMATIPEAVEMARATGLTLLQVGVGAGVRVRVGVWGRLGVGVGVGVRVEDDPPQYMKEGEMTPVWFFEFGVWT